MLRREDHVGLPHANGNFRRIQIHSHSPACLYKRWSGVAKLAVLRAWFYARLVLSPVGHD